MKVKNALFCFITFFQNIPEPLVQGGIMLYPLEIYEIEDSNKIGNSSNIQLESYN